MADYFPIVYVRGYAMSSAEVESTFDKPYYGFNLGATQVKQGRDERPSMAIFESPVVRLLTDQKYHDTFGRYVDRQNNPIPNRAADVWRRTLWIFRFYDAESRLRDGNRSEDDIETYAERLAIFLDKVRKACGNPDGFKVNLVAHSMGGLVARCYLQYESLFERPELKEIAPVDVNKLFTYGTPHRGISFRDGLGWAEDIRDLIGWRGSDAFGEDRMRDYLSLQGPNQPLHTYKPARGNLPKERIFSIVGTNYQDYVVGSAQAAVGPGSDGLVAIENAYVKGAPRAYIHRSHSGPFGMVNSEEAYQNLERFLFGSLRYELELAPITLGKSRLPGQKPNDAVEYLLVEVTMVVRGLRCYIQNRQEPTMSAISVPFDGKQQKEEDATHLYTGFLHTSQQMRERGDHYIRAAIDLRIEPHYRNEGLLWDSHYEGADVLRDRLYVRIDPDTYEAAYHWGSPDNYEPVKLVNDSHVFPLPSRIEKWIECQGIRVRTVPWS